jgi:hypothetical protein
MNIIGLLNSSNNLKSPNHHFAFSLQISLEKHCALSSGIPFNYLHSSYQCFGTVFPHKGAIAKSYPDA